jgi:hypothetical protein
MASLPLLSSSTTATDAISTEAMQKAKRQASAIIGRVSHCSSITMTHGHATLSELMY